MAELIGSLAFLSSMAGGILMMLLAVFIPVMAVSVTLSIRKIARQLERINNTLESRTGV